MAWLFTDLYSWKAEQVEKTTPNPITSFQSNSIKNIKNFKNMVRSGFPSFQVYTWSGYIEKLEDKQVDNEEFHNSIYMFNLQNRILQSNIFGKAHWIGTSNCTETCKQEKVGSYVMLCCQNFYKSSYTPVP